MAPRYYVATDPNGVERSDGTTTTWVLPTEDGTPSPELEQSGDPLVLHEVTSLLEVLDDVIWVAEATSGGVPTAHDGEIHVDAARLVARTAWDTAAAALFAIDCAEHVLGDAGSVELPGGRTLEQVLVDARRCVEGATDSDHQLGFLSRLATLRRLRREGNEVTDVAFGLTIDDSARALDSTLDPAWLTASSVAESVFSALEALRHVAAPRYASAREEHADAHRGDDVHIPVPYELPFGPVMVGARHESPYLPASIAARDAAARARELEQARGGNDAEQREREWQVTRLEEALGEPVTP